MVRTPKHTIEFSIASTAVANIQAAKIRIMSEMLSVLLNKTRNLEKYSVKRYDTLRFG